MEARVSFLEKMEKQHEIEHKEIFKRLNFKRYIERFNLTEEKQENKTLEDLFKIIEIQQIDETLKIIKQQKKIYYYITTKQTNNPNDIIKEEINAIYIYNNEIQFAMTDLTITSNIFSMNKNCTNCKYKCNLYKIKKRVYSYNK